MCTVYACVRLTGWWGRRWNKFGERMAGAKKRRKMKLLTAVYRTSWSTREQRKIKNIYICFLYAPYSLNLILHKGILEGVVCSVNHLES